jgi:hypothetical protein
VDNPRLARFNRVTPPPGPVLLKPRPRIMILIVNFFKISFSLSYETPLDLLILGAGIVTIAGALVITHYAFVLRHRVSKG